MNLDSFFFFFYVTSWGEVLYSKDCVASTLFVDL